MLLAISSARSYLRLGVASVHGALDWQMASTLTAVPIQCRSFGPLVSYLKFTCIRARFADQGKAVRRY